MGNTGTTRLRYIWIEGPRPHDGAFDTTSVCEGNSNCSLQTVK